MAEEQNLAYMSELLKYSEVAWTIKVDMSE